ncbi:trigger factor [Wenzhouxiangella limi]|uniref:Trigger factor n=1 Tax=Wenzhouxiangella limi TaxID=2707351 RepID=A0A845V2Y9_9GAMM|nr:trigger factor [Wenzhouxiangella limi]NDY97084.1 trigger factor [Wenzhouxiangella limi]
MQVSVEKTGDLERRMTVQVPGDDITSKVNSRLSELRRQVRLKGFRPGKVPLNVVRQRYGKQVREEVLGQVMESSLQEAIGQEEMRVAGVSRLEPASGPDFEGDFEFIAELEVFPEMPEIEIADLAFERPVAEVADSDVDDMIDTLRQQRREWETVERPAAMDDRVRLTYVADAEGERVPEVGHHELAPTLGNMTTFPQLEEALTGMSAGESKEVELTFPEDYRYQALAGKTAKVELSVQEVQASEMPEVDDAFADSFGVDGGVEQLRADVRRNLERELRQAVTNRLKTAVTDALSEKYADLALPRSSVTQEARQMVQQMQQQSGQQADLPLEQFMPMAERRLRLGLLMGELARQNEISIDQGRVQQKLEEVADTYEDPSQIIEIYRADKNLMDQLENLVLEEQVIDLVLDKAEVADKTMSFKEALET